MIKHIPSYTGFELARGIAAVMVMLTHYSIMLTTERTVLNFLWTGVDLFFVISGFVFARYILYSGFDVKPFFVRRFFRIYPLYFASLIIYFLVTGDHERKVEYFINHLYFAQTSRSKAELEFFNPAYWSLPVEVEFYLLIPLLALIMRFRHSLIVLTVLALMAKLAIVLLSTPKTVDIYKLLNVHITGILPEFLIGIYLYKFVTLSEPLSSEYRNTLRTLSLVTGFVILAVLAYIFVRYGQPIFHEIRLFGGFYNTLCALGYACILYSLAFVRRDNTSPRLAVIFASIGAISYPLYLIHNASPKIVKMTGYELTSYQTFTACVVVTLVLSILLHRLVEEPFRLYGRRLSGKIA